MRPRFWFSNVILISLFTSACSVAAAPIIFAKIDGAEARVVVRSIRDAAHLHVNGVVVYGDVHISSRDYIAKANLSCFYLSAANQQSSKPYVDSVAHILTNDFSADSDGAVRAQLYWVFKGRKVADIKANDLALVADQSHGSCLVHAGAPKVGPE